MKDIYLYVSMLGNFSLTLLVVHLLDQNRRLIHGYERLVDEMNIVGRIRWFAREI